MRRATGNRWTPMRGMNHNIFAEGPSECHFKAIYSAIIILRSMTLSAWSSYCVLPIQITIYCCWLIPDLVICCLFFLAASPWFTWGRGYWFHDFLLLTVDCYLRSRDHPSGIWLLFKVRGPSQGQKRGRRAAQLQQLHQRHLLHTVRRCPTVRPSASAYC